MVKGVFLYSPVVFGECRSYPKETLFWHTLKSVLFYCEEKYMRKQIIDVTGTPLTPSRQGNKCLGNGEHSEYECCCEECDYYLRCFPQFDWRLKRNKFKKWVKSLFKID